MDSVLSFGLGAITIASFVGSAVWAVSRIRTDTSLLRMSIDHLSHSVNRLTRSVDTLDHRVNDHEKRIITLEQRMAPEG